jgi:putative DNA modification/repair radical SAM protein
MYECLWLLREVYGFAGYIHAKVVPGVSAELLTQIGLVADRLSVNIEMPTSESLSILAPQKKPEKIFSSMTQITKTQIEQKTLKSAGNMKRLKPAGYGGDETFDSITGAGEAYLSADDPGSEGLLIRRSTGGHIVSESRRANWKEKFAPAGQTTQMVIGASPESDRQIVRMSEALYRRFTMKRVYYAAYIPVSSAPELPPLLTPPPLKREHRLYQADWLMRFYGFSAEEILTEDSPNLDYDLDPKVVWALRNIEVYPIEVNSASEAELLRIPGVGNISVKRIMRHRRIQKVRYDDLKKMGVVLKRARFFITVDGKYYGGKEPEPEKLRTLFALEESLGILSVHAGTSASASDHLPDHLNDKGGTHLDAGEIRKAMGGGEKPQISLFEYSL